MVHSFKYYIEKKLVKKSTKNTGQAKALQKRAKQRLEYIRKQKITEENASFIFEDIYEAAREAAQSLMSQKGYKPYSHEAIIAFLQKYYPKEIKPDKTNTLDRYRIIRNNLLYRASSIDKKETEKALQFATELITKIEKIKNNGP